MTPKKRVTPQCVLCENPGTFTPMFTNLKPDLCAEHYKHALNYQAEQATKDH